jgi:hypothetical protein
MGNMTTTAPHPEPGYWFAQGRAAGQAGDLTDPDPDDFGRIFGDPMPPQEWVTAYILGRIQGGQDLFNGRVTDPEAKAAEFCAAVSQFPLRVILAAWLAGRLKRWSSKIAQ